MVAEGLEVSMNKRAERAVRHALWPEDLVVPAGHVTALGSRRLCERGFDRGHVLSEHLGERVVVQFHAGVDIGVELQPDSAQDGPLGL